MDAGLKKGSCLDIEVAAVTQTGDFSLHQSRRITKPAPGSNSLWGLWVHITGHCTPPQTFLNRYEPHVCPWATGSPAGKGRGGAPRKEAHQRTPVLRNGVDDSPHGTLSSDLALTLCPAYWQGLGEVIEGGSWVSHKPRGRTLTLLRNSRLSQKKAGETNFYSFFLLLVFVCLWS